jgi:hypothetical protein
MPTWWAMKAVRRVIAGATTPLPAIAAGECPPHGHKAGNPPRVVVNRPTAPLMFAGIGRGREQPDLDAGPRVARRLSWRVRTRATRRAAR